MTIYSLDILLSQFGAVCCSMSNSNCCFLTCIQVYLSTYGLGSVQDQQVDGFKGWAGLIVRGVNLDFVFRVCAPAFQLQLMESHAVLVTCSNAPFQFLDVRRLSAFRPGVPRPALAQGLDVFWHTFLRTVTPSCNRSLFQMQDQAPRPGFVFCTMFAWGWPATPASMSCSRLQPVFVDKHWVNGIWRPTSTSFWPQHPFKLSLETTSESILASTPDDHPTSPGWCVRWNFVLRPGICRWYFVGTSVVLSRTAKKMVSVLSPNR